MDAGTAGIIGSIAGAVAGAITGFFLSEHSQKKNSQERNTTTREAIRKEIGYNIDALAHAKIGKQLPTRSVQIWSDQLSNAILAFNSNEFQKIHRFYIDLHNIHKHVNIEGKITEVSIKHIKELIDSGNPVVT